jgi:hypothetical protein
VAEVQRLASSDEVIGEDAEETAMTKKILPLTAALLLGCAATNVAASEPATGLRFPAASASANSKGETGETANCPIKKTVGRKTLCFQNDPALTKQQGGH